MEQTGPYLPYPPYLHLYSTSQSWNHHSGYTLHTTTGLTLYWYPSLRITRGSTLFWYPRCLYPPHYHCLNPLPISFYHTAAGSTLYWYPPTTLPQAQPSADIHPTHNYWLNSLLISTLDTSSNLPPTKLSSDIHPPDYHWANLLLISVLDTTLHSNTGSSLYWNPPPPPEYRWLNPLLISTFYAIIGWIPFWYPPPLWSLAQPSADIHAGCTIHTTTGLTLYGYLCSPHSAPYHWLDPLLRSMLAPSSTRATGPTLH